MRKTKENQRPVKQVTAFRRAARDLGADESQERFDMALKAIGRAKRQVEKSSKRDKPRP